MSQPIELSLEQQFNIRSFQTQVEKNMYKAFLKHQWGLDSNPWAPQ